MKKVWSIIFIVINWSLWLTASFNPILTTNRDIIPFWILFMVLLGAFSTIFFIHAFPAEWPDTLPGTKSADETEEM